MAITGIDTIDGKQIIAAGASSAVKAAQDSNGNSITATYQSTAGMSDYATTADVTGKQDVLTFNYNESDLITGINSSGIAIGGSLPASADEACQVVTANSADWNEVSAKADTSATIPVADALSSIIRNSDYIGLAADTAGNFCQIVARNGDPQSAWVVEYKNDTISRNIYWGGNKSTTWPTTSTWTISPHYLQLADSFTVSPGWLVASGVITANTEGFTANNLAANTAGIIANNLAATNGGITASGLTAGAGASFIIKCAPEVFSGGNLTGFTFSSQNTAFGSAVLTTAGGNSIVQMYSPKFEVRNISGAGFNIEGSGAKGYDHNGNVVWDTTKPAKLIGWANYQGTAIDPRATGINGGIIATVYPDQIPTTMTISSAPYSYMNGYGLFAINPSNGTTLSVDTTYGTISVQQTGMSATAVMNSSDVKYNKYNSAISATDVWSLTGSVQKYELEGDSAVSSISAIAGSALYCPLASLNTEGITDIQLVNELPVDPVSTVLYLIPEA